MNRSNKELLTEWSLNSYADYTKELEKYCDELEKKNKSLQDFIDKRIKFRNGLKKEIYKRGYTLKEFSCIADIPVMSLYGITNGSYKAVSGPSIYKIAKALGMSYEEIEQMTKEGLKDE